METIIQTVQEKIKALEYDQAYYVKKMTETSESLGKLKNELSELQEKIAHETLT